MSQAIQADDEAGEDAVDKELGYLTSIREALLAFFAPPKIDWNDNYSEDPGTPREPPAKGERSSSFSVEFHNSPAGKAATPRLEPGAPADADALSDTNKPLKARPLKRPAGADAPSAEGDEPPPAPGAAGSKKPRTDVDSAACTARLDLPALVSPSDSLSNAAGRQKEATAAAS